MNFDVNSFEMIAAEEASKVCESIMDELLSSLPVNDDLVNSDANVSEAPKTFFKALSFYDDPIDDDPILPFESFFDSEESTCVPSEFTQPFFDTEEHSEPELLNCSDSESNEIVSSIIDSILESVLEKELLREKLPLFIPFH